MFSLQLGWTLKTIMGSDLILKLMGKSIKSIYKLKVITSLNMLAW